MIDNILKARIEDTYSICQNTQKPKFIGFLSIEQVSFACNILSNYNCKYNFFGGYSDSQRQVLCCYPDWCNNPEFPISSFTIIYPKIYKLSHRDFLGSLIGLGLKRDVIGDILIEEGRAVVFVLNDVAKYINEQLCKVGNIGVKVVSGFVEPLPISNVFTVFSTTVSSNRLDCVVSSLINSSRNIATEKIQMNLVSVNSVIVNKNTKSIMNNDVISIKGYGKFIIVSLNEFTKKNRIKLIYKKYK